MDELLLELCIGRIDAPDGSCIVLIDEGGLWWSRGEKFEWLLLPMEEGGGIGAPIDDFCCIGLEFISPPMLLLLCMLCVG